MIEYPAVISYDKEDDVYNVSFPDLPGCFTYGDSLEEAKIHAKKALTGFHESIDSRKLKIPKPSNPTGEAVFYIRPEKNVAFAIWLKQKREEKGFTQEQIAGKLGIAYQTYQRFEDPAKSNPTLKTITRLEEVLHEKVLQV
jgi:antitoxin HicB